MANDFSLAIFFIVNEEMLLFFILLNLSHQ
jgi:hypothetical protein